MSAGGGVGWLRAAVRRLEARAGKGERCVRCRLLTRQSSPRQVEAASLTPPGDTILVACEFCGRVMGVKLAGSTKQARAIELFAYAPLEAQYTDPRASAYRHWARLVKGKGYGEGFLGHRAPAPSGVPARARPEVRSLFRLRAEAAELVGRRRRRLAAEHGEEPFPRHAELVGSIKQRAQALCAEWPHGRDLFNLAREVAFNEARAELERVMTGRPLPATASALKDLRKRWSEEVEGARRRQERRGEELRRLEEGEKRRLEEAARKWKERRHAREAGRAPREAAAEESAAGAEETAGTGAAIRVAAAEADKTESTASPTDPPIQRRPHSGNGQDEPPRTMTPIRRA